MDGFLRSPSPVWNLSTSPCEESGSSCDFMHIWTWAIKPGTSMYPFTWAHILTYFHQVLIWSVQVHQIFKHDFEEIVIQGDQLCSCCNQMGFFGKSSDNAGEKKRDLEKQCGTWGASISFTLSLSWFEKLQKKFQMQWSTIWWGIHLKMQKRMLQFSLAIQSYSWLASFASAPPTLALGSIGFEYPGVLSLNEHVMLVL